jgi:hypothetical protein
MNNNKVILLPRIEQQTRHPLRFKTRYSYGCERCGVFEIVKSWVTCNSQCPLIHSTSFHSYNIATGFRSSNDIKIQTRNLNKESVQPPLLISRLHSDTTALVPVVGLLYLPILLIVWHPYRLDSQSTCCSARRIYRALCSSRKPVVIH